jgi:bacillolysin
MKKIKTLILCGALLLPLGLLAQQPTAAQPLRQFEQKTGAQISKNPALGTANFIRFPQGRAMELEGATAERKSQQFLRENGAALGIGTPKETYFFKKSQKDNIGFERSSFEQRYQGIPVFDGQLNFVFNRSGNLTSVSGNFVPSIKVSAKPDLSEQKAANIALHHVDGNTKLYVARKEPYIYDTKLYIFHDGMAKGQHGTAHLAYMVEIKDDAYIREFVWVDAHTGQILEQWTGIHSALNRFLYETSVVPANLRWSEGDAFPGSLDQWQQNEVQVAGHSYYFYKNAFGWTSYDNADHSMTTINNNPDISCPNANWNGTTANYCTGTAADDVVAHEWGHAFTEYTCGLIYQYQTGALNESLSDIWGETIDLLNGYQDSGENNAVRTGTSCSESNRWKMGEDASAFGGAIRDMWYPTCNSDPGKVTDSQYVCGTGDSGGVHTNSGVPNHCYALLVDGGTYNGQTITGIGFTKAAHIFWRAQSTYLSRTSDFPAFADALEAAGNDLLGMNLEGLTTSSTPAGPSGQIITASDLTQLNKAILATQLRTIPSSCPPTPMLGTAPALCSAATAGGSIFYEDWETGMDAWTVTNVGSNSSTWTTRNWELLSNLPENRAGTGIFGTDPTFGDCSTDFENGIIRLESPQINIPAGATGPFLMAFNHYVSMEDTWDGGNIKYSKNGGAWTLLPSSAFTTNAYNKTLDNTSNNDNPLKGQTAFTGADANSVSGTWGQSQVSFAGISLAAGDNIRLRWEVGTDGCNGWDGWYLDEIRIYTCTAITDGFTIAQTNSPQSVCQPNNAAFTFTTTATGAFSGNITLAATGNPSGTSVSFSPNPVAVGSPFTMTVSGTGSAALGASTITVTGTSASLMDSEDVSLTIANGTLSATTLSSPANGATGVATSPALSWAATSGAATYDLQVATDAAFTNIVSNQTGLTGTSFTASSLMPITTYRWRVRGVNSCATGAWSTTFSFTTISGPICLIDEDFTGGQPTGWTFTVTGSGDDPNWYFGTENLGLSSYDNPSTGNWANYNDDGNGSGAGNNIATATTPVMDMSSYTNLSLSFVYNFQMVASGETVRLSVTDGSQTQYWNGTSWTPTASSWLTSDNEGTFNQPLPTGLNTATLQISLVFNDNNTWSWGFGFDDFLLCGDPIEPTCADDLNIPDNPIPSDAYQADLTITSSGVVPSGNTVSFESQEITLQAGFHAEAGCDFHAFIGGCPASFGKAATQKTVTMAPERKAQVAEDFDANKMPRGLEVQVLPNPFSNTATVRYFVPSEGGASVTLMDLNGRALRTLSNGQAKAAGWHEATIESNGLAKGVYLLHVRTATESTTKKVVLVQ